MNHRIIFYYQTFTSLQPLLIKNTVVTHIHVSSIHFGYDNDNDNKPYIHLNDDPPTANKFIDVWKQLEEASKLGIKIILMVGGAGGAFSRLFSNFDIFYLLLMDTIRKYPFICGIDLDVEEPVPLNNIKMLISKLDQDFGKEFIITMAPVAYALENNTPGMGGFLYNELYKSEEGQRIDYFNTQFYYDYSSDSYEKVINNGYPASKVVLGMTSSMDINNSKKIVAELSKKYPDFGGVFDWEYINAPPDGEKDPYQWAIEMNTSMTISNPSYLDMIINFLYSYYN